MNELIDGMTFEEAFAWWEEVGEKIRLYDIERKALSSHKWPEIVNPFKEDACPRFPVECLPRAMEDYARANSDTSGFDLGAYGFSLFMYAAALVDHRHKIDVGPFKAPAFLWGGLVDRSGGGKSPVFAACKRFVEEHNRRLCEQTERSIFNWQEECRAIGSRKKDEHPEKPPIKQFIAVDSTTEALGEALYGMPSGLLFGAEEITEFIGRMDAYSGGTGGKDRGLYLRAFDGGFSSINRLSKGPMYFKNFSIAIVAGMQPKKLAELFRKSGGSSDGLYQRFLVYQMQDAGLASYTGRVPGRVIDSCREVYTFIEGQKWAENSEPFTLDHEARDMMEDFHNNCRVIATSSGGDAFSEHVNKFPGFLARVSLALHFIEGSVSGHLGSVVSLDTYKRAEKIVKCLLAHSKAIYPLFDGGMDRGQKLARAAAESILHHRWTEFHRGDLTRASSEWRGITEFDAQTAIDNLIMYGWVEDITPPTQPGKKGRPSKGHYLVNPDVHLEFMDHARGISEMKDRKRMALMRNLTSESL